MSVIYEMLASNWKGNPRQFQFSRSESWYENCWSWWKLLLQMTNFDHIMINSWSFTILSLLYIALMLQSDPKVRNQYGDFAI